MQLNRLQLSLLFIAWAAVYLWVSGEDYKDSKKMESIQTEQRSR